MQVDIDDADRISEDFRVAGRVSRRTSPRILGDTRIAGGSLLDIRGGCRGDWAPGKAVMKGLESARYALYLRPHSAGTVRPRVQRRPTTRELRQAVPPIVANARHAGGVGPAQPSIPRRRPVLGPRVEESLGARRLYHLHGVPPGQPRRMRSGRRELRPPELEDRRRVRQTDVRPASTAASSRSSRVSTSGGRRRFSSDVRS